jgi:hypothetical protein
MTPDEAFAELDRRYPQPQPLRRLYSGYATAPMAVTTTGVNGPPATTPQPPATPHATPAAPPEKGEAYGDILTDAFVEISKFFAHLDPEEGDEAMLRSVVTAAKATVKRVEAGAVAVSSPAVLRKLKATAKAMKRTLEDMIDEDVDDADVDANPHGDGDKSVVKKKGGRKA